VRRTLVIVKRTSALMAGAIVAFIAYKAIRLNYMGSASWTAANMAVRTDDGVMRSVGPITRVTVLAWKYYRCGDAMCAWTKMSVTGASGSGTATLLLDNRLGGLWNTRAGCFRSQSGEAQPIRALEPRHCTELAEPPSEPAAFPVRSWRDWLSLP
jgi:hypothetical protein